MNDLNGRLAALSADQRAQLSARLAAQPQDAGPIAVLGVGCRFPGGANSPEDFWRALCQGRDAVRSAPAERWDAGEFFAAGTDIGGKTNSHSGGFLDQVDLFDAEYFGLSPREAAHMDPQQRLVLETACEALEDAGQMTERLSGCAAGVFIGVQSHSSDYYRMQAGKLERLDTYTPTGTAHSILANRLSFLLDLRGPSLAVDTACSSSLVAVHLACQSLRVRESDLAIAGGVNLILSPDSQICLGKMEMMAPDERCKTFDHRANGFVRGEGCGVIVLKRLADALRDGDPVLAVILGSAVNQDGASNGLTAPSGPAQQAVIRRALEVARVAPGQVGYVETHGTGTALGDPIEVESLSAVLGSGSATASPCYLGALKTNLGHLEAASGIAGLIKTILCLKHGAIPPNLHFEKLNPHIEFAGTRFVLPAGIQPWPRNGEARIAGVSSFGFGGTNAHVVVADPPAHRPPQAAGSQPRELLLTISARSETALRALAASYIEFLTIGEGAQLRPGDIAYTAALRRCQHDFRWSVSGSGPADWAAAFRRLLAGECEAARAEASFPDRGACVLLPRYPWQRQRHWLPPSAGVQSTDARREPPADWFYELDWEALGSLDLESTSLSALASAELPKLHAALQQCFPAVEREYGDDSLEDLRGLLDRSSAEYIWEAFAALGADGSPGAHWAKAGFPRRLNLLSRYDRLTGRLLQILAEAGFLKEGGEYWTVLPREAGSGQSDHPAEKIAGASEIQRLHDRCGGRLAEVLRGSCDPLELLFTGGATAEAIYRDAGPSRIGNQMAAEALRECLAQLPAGRKLRVLEIGAGTGGTTAALLPLLPADRCEYLFTDVSPLFLTQAAKNFAAFPFVRFELLDLERPPAEQGFGGGRFDLIVAANVVHATRDLMVSLGNARGLLADAGMLLLLECTAPRPWMDITFGLTEGWWRFTDRPLREAHPLIDESTWLRLLADAGFSDASALPLQRSNSAILDQALIFARNAADSKSSGRAEYLVVAESGELASEFKRQVESRGETCRIAHPGSPDELRAALAQASPGCKTVYLASSGACGFAGLVDACQHPLRVVQAMLAAGLSPGTGLWLVTCGSQPVNGLPAPAGSVSWGLGRGAAIEAPGISMRMVDLDPAENIADSVAALLAEIGNIGTEDQVAVRDGKRYAPRLKRSAALASGHPPLRVTGTHLITGGLGALGSRLALHLAGRGASHLMLVGKRALPDRSHWDSLSAGDPDLARVETVRRIEATGAKVTVAAVDLADDAALTAWFGSLDFEAPLRGLWHAAMSFSSAPMGDLELDAVREMIAVKSGAAWRLHELTQAHPLDHFVLYSSTTALWGATGLAHYAAANAFLDALAHSRRANQLPATVINWGAWEETHGLSASAERDRAAGTGLRLMPAPVALAALDRVLAAGVPQAIVADIDWPVFKPIYESRGHRPFLARIGAPPKKADNQGSPLIDQLLQAAPDERRELVVLHLREILAAVLGIGTGGVIDRDRGFFDLGMDSITSVQMRARLERDLGRSLPNTLIFTHSTLNLLADYLAAELFRSAPEIHGGTRRVVADLKVRAPAVEAANRSAIAIVGIGCRYPGGITGPDSFWELLRTGRDAITEVPADRWRISDWYDADRSAPGKTSSRWGGFLDGIDRFDAHFFGIAPREAATLDPQQRILLEVAWEALEHGGQPFAELAGSQTGVFVGITNTEYFQHLLRILRPEDLSPYIGSGNVLNAAAGRLAFHLGTHGPSVAIDTACSSSLTAVHLACQGLRSGDCAMALAGGVNVIVVPETSVMFSKWGMMAADGRCKTFDADADGFVRAEGCGIVVLKRLDDALAAGDRVLAVIEGSSVNQDGRSSGLTVPNGIAQQAVVRQALANAGLEPGQIDYVEAHGTGTSLGDPIEVDALSAVFGPGRDALRKLRIGSVKTNLGHTESASGVAGLIKCVLALEHEQLPPQLHFRHPSPGIPWDAIPIEVATELAPWPRQAVPRRAGVSSFGFSGANAHVILSEAPAVSAPAAGSDRPRHILAFSAADPAALTKLATRHAEALRKEAAAADYCFTANTGRAHFRHRAAISGATGAELAEALSRFADAARGNVSGEPVKIAFLFTGQGSQYAGMGRQLYDSQPLFRAELDRCAALLEPHLDRPLAELIFAPPDRAAELDQTRYTQPALFALEWSLAELWRSWGIEPAALLGHSVGEYTAACQAGVMSLEDGLGLISARARLMQSLPPGGMMAAVAADEVTVREFLRPGSAIAAINGARNVVVSGEAGVVRHILGALKTRRISSVPLAVSRAFHSPLLDPILDEFERIAGRIQSRPPVAPLISNLTGAWQTGAPDAAYWRAHARNPVRFAAGIQELQRKGCEVFLEIGPAPVLINMARQCLGDGPQAWLPSLARDCDEWTQILESLSTLYLRGAPVDWTGFDRGYPRRRIALPTYPFQRKRFWVDAAGPLVQRAPGSPLVKERIFTGSFAANSPAWMADHVVGGQVVVPLTAHVEMALEAGAEILGTKSLAIDDLVVREPLIAGESVQVQLVASPLEARAGYEFRVISLGRPEPDGWRLHATGIFDRLPPAVSDDCAPGAGSDRLDAEEHYRIFASHGIDFGPAFRGVASVTRGSQIATGEIRQPAALTGQYLFHPALLDACLQPLIHAWTIEPGAFLPFAIQRIELRGEPAAAMTSHCRATSQFAGDAMIFDEEGHVVVSVRGLAAKRVERDSIYELQWVSAGTSLPQVPGGAGRWLIFADDGSTGDGLAAELRRRGGACVMVRPAAAFEKFGTEEYGLNPACRTDYDGLLEATAQTGHGVSGIVHLWSLNANMAEISPAREIMEAQDLSCRSLLYLSQSLVAAGRLPARGLWAVTRGSQAAGGDIHRLALSQSTVWGLSKVLSLEHPELGVMRLDLDPGVKTGEAERIADILSRPAEEAQLAIRGGQTYACRLARRGREAASPEGLVATEPGRLDSLEWRTSKRRTPGPGEVEIRVAAAAVNFRDVLSALDMYPGDAGPLGGEVAGEIVAVGSDVAGFAVGDAVAALAIGGFNRYVVTNADLSIKKPANWSFAEIATVPAAFATAYHALVQLGQMRPGEWVLIHTATGGVGLAAIQLARQAGCRIIATAGSPRKREYLQSLGIEHVFDSRSPAFADGIRALLGENGGVDLVLNSLSGELILPSLSILSSRGRFVELGKRDIWEPSRVAAMRPEARYFIVDLAAISRESPGEFRAIFAAASASIAAGTFHAPPVEIFPREAVQAAFRQMAQARHIGKIVVGFDAKGDASTGRLSANPNATYLITGGLAGLGLRTAEWLVERGARHLALMARGGPDEEALSALDAMRKRGVNVAVCHGDVSQPRDLDLVLEEIRKKHPPLRGVIHSAGVLDDGAILQQEWGRFETVFAPKVAGGWNLHLATREMPLDFFVCYSSASAVLGSRGQGNHAAANAFLDALAHHRRSLGLPGLSINWGPWSDIGAAARRDVFERAAEHGIHAISPAEGIAALERLIADGSVQAVVVPMDWNRFLAGDLPAAERSFFAKLNGRPAARNAPRPAMDAKPPESLIAEAVPAQRRKMIQSTVRESILGVLGLEPDFQLDPLQGFTALGFDSLMSIELRNRLQTRMGRPLPAALAFNYPTLNTLVDYFCQECADMSSVEAPNLSRIASGADREPDISELEQLSHEETEKLLTEELARARELL